MVAIHTSVPLQDLSLLGFYQFWVDTWVWILDQGLEMQNSSLGFQNNFILYCDYIL